MLRSMMDDPLSQPLMRVRQGTLIAGVCGGIAKWLGWDPTLVRLGYVVLSVALGGVPRRPHLHPVVDPDAAGAGVAQLAAVARDDDLRVAVGAPVELRESRAAARSRRSPAPRTTTIAPGTSHPPSASAASARSPRPLP